MASDLLFLHSSTKRRSLAVASVAASLIGLADWATGENASLAFLYVLPALLVGVVADRASIVASSAAFSLLGEAFGATPWATDYPVRLFMGFMAFAGVGLFVCELARNRQRVLEQSALLAEQVRRREEAEEERRILIQSSPAAIMTIAGDRRILLANEAAEALLGRGSGSICGTDVSEFLPALGAVFEHAGSSYRTAMECVGVRGEGEAFLAQVWFSTYSTHAGPQLAAIVVDASDELRDRETTGFNSIAATSRVLFSAVSHEVRNLCAAVSVTHANLARTPGLSENVDFQALGRLVEGLQQIAKSELRLSADTSGKTISIETVLGELRIVLEPTCKDAGVATEWCVSETLPRVFGDHHVLLQIFLNLAQNSVHALRDVASPRLTISASVDERSVLVRFRDNGNGVAAPEQLFRPFGQAREGVGIGLFVSRTMARQFAGDVEYEPAAHGSCFAVRLTPVGDS